MLWDVYETLSGPGGIIETFIETKTFGSFVVPSTADPSDHTTWPQLSPAASWDAEIVGADVRTYIFRNVRIERVLS